MSDKLIDPSKSNIELNAKTMRLGLAVRVKRGGFDDLHRHSHSVGGGSRSRRSKKRSISR